MLLVESTVQYLEASRHMVLWSPAQEMHIHSSLNAHS